MVSLADLDEELKSRDGSEQAIPGNNLSSPVASDNQYLNVLPKSFHNADTGNLKFPLNYLGDALASIAQTGQSASNFIYSPIEKAFPNIFHPINQDFSSTFGVPNPSAGDLTAQEIGRGTVKYAPFGIAASKVAPFLGSLATKAAGYIPEALNGLKMGEASAAGMPALQNLLSSAGRGLSSTTGANILGAGAFGVSEDPSNPIAGAAKGLLGLGAATGLVKGGSGLLNLGTDQIAKSALGQKISGLTESFGNGQDNVADMAKSALERQLSKMGVGLSESPNVTNMASSSLQRQITKLGDDLGFPDNPSAYKTAAETLGELKKQEGAAHATKSHLMEAADDAAENNDEIEPFNSKSYKRAIKGQLEELQSDSPMVQKNNQSAIDVLKGIQSQDIDSFTSAQQHAQDLNSLIRDYPKTDSSVTYQHLKRARGAIEDSINKNIDTAGLHDIPDPLGTPGMSLQDSLVASRNAASYLTKVRANTYQKTFSPSGKIVSTALNNYQKSGAPPEQGGNFISNFMPGAKNTGTDRFEKLATILGDRDDAKQLIKQNHFVSAFKNGEMDHDVFLKQYNKLTPTQQSYLFSPEESQNINLYSKIRGPINPLNETGDTGNTKFKALAQALGSKDAATDSIKQNHFSGTIQDGEMDHAAFLNKYNELSKPQKEYLFNPTENQNIGLYGKLRKTANVDPLAETTDTGNTKFQNLAKALGSKDVAVNSIKQHYFADTMINGQLDKDAFLSKYNKLRPHQQEYLFTPQENQQIQLLGKLIGPQKQFFNKEKPNVPMSLGQIPGALLNFIGHNAPGLLAKNPNISAWAINRAANRPGNDALSNALQRLVVPRASVIGVAPNNNQQQQ